MAGTTTSSGLNNLLSSTNQQQTTLPSWYDTAQQNVINQAGNALGQAPGLGQTTAQGAINTLQGANNPFTQAQTSLNQIAQGAVNPFTTDPNTGITTPNTNTALGSLFSAQRQQLNQLLPTLNAGTEASTIGSGNFGSLRGQTALDTSSANALAALQAQQDTAALQNQQIGATAGGALGNVGAQGITADLTTGAAQMNAPFQAPVNYANLVNAVNAPATVSLQNQQSPLQMVSSIASLPTAAGNLLTSIFGKGSGTPGTAGYVAPGLSSLFNQYFGSNSTPTLGVGQMTDPTTGQIVTDPTYGSGQTSSGVDLSNAGVSDTQQQYGV